MVHRLIVVMAFLMLGLSLYGQKWGDRFNAGLVFGFNAAQLDGDSQYGYDKLGWLTGISGMMKLNKRANVSVGLLFSQKGSQPKDYERTIPKSIDYVPTVFSLNFAEVPVMINHRVSKNQKGVYIIQLQAGFVYSRLLSSKVEEVSIFSKKIADVSYTQYQEYFNSEEWSVRVGAAAFILPKLTFGMTFSNAFSDLFDARAIGIPLRNLKSFHLGFQFSYFLNP